MKKVTLIYTWGKVKQIIFSRSNDNLTCLHFDLLPTNPIWISSHLCPVKFCFTSSSKSWAAAFPQADVRESLIGSKCIIIKSQTFQFESSQPHLSTWHWAALYPWYIWFVLEPNLIELFLSADQQRSVFP